MSLLSTSPCSLSPSGAQGTRSSGRVDLDNLPNLSRAPGTSSSSSSLLQLTLRTLEAAHLVIAVEENAVAGVGFAQAAHPPHSVARYIVVRGAGQGLLDELTMNRAIDSSMEEAESFEPRRPG
mmetsp:Transcript_1307/g.2852  ORF Transcript_1307/g.2852 Transcript_1307/m.2852 type:complete len:123 (+) Transcript_1307:1481-1849(+)